MLTRLRALAFLGVALSAAAFPHASWAGSYSGLAQPYWFNGVLYININGTTAIDSPACRTRSIVRLLEGDYNDPVFKGKYAMLLASWYSQRAVFLVGTGQCTSEGDELISVIYP